MKENSYVNLHSLIIFVIGVLISSVFLSNNILLGQSTATSMKSMNSSSSKEQDHAEHIFDNLIASEHIPLRGQLANGDYILLMDLTPFATTVEGHSHVAAKVPCNKEGGPKVTIAAGVAPNLMSLNLGEAITNGTLDRNPIQLSTQESCLYHAELPVAVTDIILINTSNKP